MSNRAHCWHWKILIADVHEKNNFQAFQQEVIYKNRIMYALCTQNFQQYSKLRMGQQPYLLWLKLFHFVQSF